MKRAPRAIVGLIDDLEVRCDHCDCDWTGRLINLCAFGRVLPRAAGELLPLVGEAAAVGVDARRTIADRDEIARLEAALKARRDGSARDADNARRRLRQLKGTRTRTAAEPGHDAVAAQLAARARKARSDRATT